MIKENQKQNDDDDVISFKIIIIIIINRFLFSWIDIFDKLSFKKSWNLISNIFFYKN